MFLIALVTTASAGSGHTHDGGRIAADLAEGRLDQKEALWLEYQRHFEPASLPTKYQTKSLPDGLCATGVVLELQDRWEEFSPEERAQITSRVAPFKRDLLDPMLPVGKPVPPPAGNATCWGQYGSNVLSSEHFSVEWDSGISTSTAQDMLDAMEYSLEVEVEELGWRRPDGLNSYKMLVYVEGSNYAGAYTTVDYCGNVAMPYVVAGAGSFWGNWYQDMAAHEFNHAVQFGYGYGHEFWYWESTATWIEEYVYGSHNSWSSYISGYSDNPGVAMSASSQEDQTVFWHMYGMAIWDFYLDEYSGGEPFVRETWEYAETHGSYYDLSMPEVLEGVGVDFDETYRGFMAANTVMDYAESSAFPKVRTAGFVDQLPTSGGSTWQTAPSSLGQNYIRIEPALASGAEPDLLIHFDGEAMGNWAAMLVGTRGTKVIERVDFSLEGGVGTARLADYGAYDKAWLVVSPTHTQVRSYEYTWSAEGAEGLPEPAVYLEEDADNGGNGEKVGGCGCAAAPAAGGVFPLLLLFVATRRRRLSVGAR